MFYKARFPDVWTSHKALQKQTPLMRKNKYRPSAAAETVCEFGKIK